MSDGIGPTGEHPDGKIHPKDDGELVTRVGAVMKEGVCHVVVEFGASVKWMAMDPAQAREYADAFRHYADLVEKANKENAT